MPLKGETLKGYNNLPAIPIEQPLGDLLNTIPVGDPALENPTSTVTLYVDVTGSDDTGDGSQANPYATPQIAVDAIPATATRNSNYVIQCGAGTFDFPELSRIPAQVSVHLVGDRSAPVLSIPAGSVAFSNVAGKKARWTGNVGAYTATIADGSHWSLWVYPPDGYFFGGVVAASTSPNLEILQSFDSTAFFDIEVYPYSTYFQVPPKNDTLYRAAPDGGVATGGIPHFYLEGIVIKNQAPYSDFGAKGLTLYGCTFEKDPATFSFRVDLESCMFAGYAEDSIIFVQNNCSNFSAYINNPSSYFSIEGNEECSFFGCALSTISINNGGHLFIRTTDFESTGTAISMEGGSPDVSVGSCTVASTLTTFVNFSTSRNGSLQVAGTVTGSVTGNAIVITNGGQAIGVESGCNGNLTAGGSEIIVGGNGGQTFASLPATDLGAGSPQLCRAT